MIKTQGIQNLGLWVGKVQAAFPAYGFQLSRHYGDYEWVWVYVIYNGCQIGKFTFRRNLVAATYSGYRVMGTYDLQGLRYYKPADYPYDKADDLFYQWDTWARTGVLLDMEKLVAEAKALREAKVKAILDYRESHPLPKKTRIVDGREVDCTRRRKYPKRSLEGCLRNVVVDASRNLMIFNTPEATTCS